MDKLGAQFAIETMDDALSAVRAGAASFGLTPQQVMACFMAGFVAGQMHGAIDVAAGVAQVETREVAHG